MRRRRRWKIVRRIAGASVALLALLALVAVLTVQSPWFYNKVRERIVRTIETATGGRAEIGAFRFDWKRFARRSRTSRCTEPPRESPHCSTRRRSPWF